MKPALLVIDIQNVWLDSSEGLKRSVEKRLDVVNRAIGWFRQKGLPIIVVSHESARDGSVSGTRPFETAQGVDVEGSDLRITKHYPSSFQKTGLESMLRERDCDTVAIVGLSASGCALATFFGALERDFTAYIVKGGVAASLEEHVRFAEEICDVVSVDSFDQLLR